MMLGYHNRQEANAELFLPGGWFRTGDLVRVDSAGLWYYEGRIKDMVRRSGENISSAEVEMVVASMPGVEHAAVVPIPDSLRDEEVKVIVVPKPGAQLTAADVVAWAATGLAAFKVPRYVEFREALPFTPSGKVQKGALRAEDPLNERVVDTRATSPSSASTERPVA